MVGPASEFNFMQTARNCSPILDNFQKINGNQETASGQERGAEREPGPPCSPLGFPLFSARCGSGLHRELSQP